ncbi:MAG: transcriptional repressor LexA [Gammaproteobacteria bacterium]|nr:transcriptional repressor LexA [Gammaproteobacteria bacterium]
MQQLTDRQMEVLEMIKNYIEEHGVPPTRAEMANELGFRSPNAAEDHLRALARKGAIEMLPGASRGIRVVATEDDWGLPLIGRVAAGSPIYAEEHIDDWYPMTADIFKPTADYLLRVQGMSMRDAGIFDGDLLAVHKTKRIRNGQIVVARLEDEVTVKRYEKKANTVYLHPENPDFSIIEVDLSTRALSIEGVAVGVLRLGGL